MNSYEEFCEELRRVYKSYKGNAAQYVEDYGMEPLEVAREGLTLRSDTEYTVQGGVSSFYLIEYDGGLIYLGYIFLEGHGKWQEKIDIGGSVKLFQELPAKYKTEEGAKLLSQLFKEATKALQCTQDYTKWLANL